MGFTCVIFIIFWTKNELSYDNFHRNSDKIYRVHRYFYDANGTENLHLPYVAPVVAPLLKEEFPEIPNITRVYHTDLVFSAGEQKLINNSVCFAEPDVLKIFDFEGLPVDTGLLAEPFTVIISDEVADKYFRGNDPIGKTFEFKDESANKYAFRVTGVFKSWKGNNHFNSGFFISFVTLESFFNKNEFKNWGSNNYETFALVPVLSPDIDKKLDLFMDEYYTGTSKGSKIRFETLKDIHFNWYGSRTYIYILISIAVLILILGSINYMNLTAALYLKRLKEIKIRKVIGASQNILAMQMLAGTILYCFIAVVIALFVVSAVSGFIRISDNPLKFNIGANPGLTTGFILLSVLTGFLSGIYPAFTISSYKPVMITTVESVMRRRTLFRNVLVVFQFVVSTGLIISFLLVSKQLNYLNSKELGLDKENIIVIPATSKLVEKLDAFRQELTQNPNIISLSASKRVPSEGLLDSGDASIVSDENVTPVGFRIAHVRIDGHFIPTYKIRLLAGRNFKENISTDLGYIINEIAVKNLGWKSPEDAIGRIIEYSGKRGSVIGVVNDFHYESLHNPISPVLMSYDPASFNRVAIKVTGSETKETIAYIEKIWQTYNISDEPFSSEYLTDRYNKLYKSEDRIKMIFSYFMIVAISIAVLGMAGLSLFIIEWRTKEIGIRKINGATVPEVMLLLNIDFVKWVVIAFIIAAPVSYFSMHKWLESFAYKTGLSVWIFVIAGLIASGIALLTVSWQSWRAATRNPVYALRNE